MLGELGAAAGSSSDARCLTNSLSFADSEAVAVGSQRFGFCSAFGIGSAGSRIFDCCLSGADVDDLRRY